MNEELAIAAMYNTYWDGLCGRLDDPDIEALRAIGSFLAGRPYVERDEFREAKALELREAHDSGSAALMALRVAYRTFTEFVIDNALVTRN